VPSWRDFRDRLDWQQGRTGFRRPATDPLALPIVFLVINNAAFGNVSLRAHVQGPLPAALPPCLITIGRPTTAHWARMASPSSTRTR
jgi:hypothetical protein